VVIDLNLTDLYPIAETFRMAWGKQVGQKASPKASERAPLVMGTSDAQLNTIVTKTTGMGFALACSSRGPAELNSAIMPSRNPTCNIRASISTFISYIYFLYLFLSCIYFLCFFLFYVYLFLLLISYISSSFLYFFLIFLSFLCLFISYINFLYFFQISAGLWRAGSTAEERQSDWGPMVSEVDLN